MGQRTTRQTSSRLLSLLTKPRTTLELRKLSHTSPQNVDQQLKRLMRRTIVQRFEIFGEAARYVYVRSDSHSMNSAQTREPKLRPVDATVLSTLQTDVASPVHRIAQIVGRDLSVTTHSVLRLAKLRLVTLTRAGRLRVARITRTGLDHSQYDRAAAKAAPYDARLAIGEESIKALLVINALGRARSREITLVTGLRKYREGGTGTANLIQWLTEKGYVSSTSGRPGSQRYHQLTASGREHAAFFLTRIPFPTPAQVRRRLRRELMHLHERQSAVARERAKKRALVRETGPPAPEGANALHPLKESKNGLSHSPDHGEEETCQRR